MVTARAQAGDARLLRGVRWRLVAWSAGSTLALLLVLGSALYFSVDASLNAAAQTQLEHQATEVAGFIARAPGGSFDEPPNDDRPPQGDPVIGQPELGGPGSGTITLVVSSTGDFVGRTPNDTTDLPVMAGVTAALDTGRDLRRATVDSAPVRVLSEAVMYQGTPHVIQVIQLRTSEQRTLDVLLLVLVVGGLAVLGMAGLVGFVYAGRALVPIRESLRRQREFAADASHELRTPLAIVRGNVEHLRRHAAQPVDKVGDALADIESEVDHLTGLVDDLLLLARSDSGAIELRRDPVDLDESAGEALQRLRALAGARRVTLQLDAAPARVQGDADRLRQLVAILVDNAIRHSPENGTVTVQVAASPPTLRVDDRGKGIRPEDLPHLFDRFWRAADAPTGGTGLGLSIAAWIAEHHGATIRAANRPDGGARFEVLFPAH
jgi:two-component system sensor histidine kinase CiaH